MVNSPHYHCRAILFLFFSSEIIKNIINIELDFYLLQFLGNDQLVMIKKMNSYPEFRQICRFYLMTLSKMAWYWWFLVKMWKLENELVIAYNHGQQEKCILVYVFFFWLSQQTRYGAKESLIVHYLCLLCWLIYTRTSLQIFNAHNIMRWISLLDEKSKLILSTIVSPKSLLMARMLR